MKNAQLVTLERAVTGRSMSRRVLAINETASASLGQVVVGRTVMRMARMRKTHMKMTTRGRVAGINLANNTVHTLFIGSRTTLELLSLPTQKGRPSIHLVA
jgi:GTP cyclohydrolase FolE2